MSNPAKRSRLSPRARFWSFTVGGLLAGILGFVWYIGLLDGNIRTVVPGRVYRSAQLSPKQLDALIREQHIRTVISLRGGDSEERWYRDESAVCRKEGVDFETVSLRATALPPPDQLSLLLKDLDQAQYPVLFHCKGGADRSGLTATLYLNLYQGLPLDEAEPKGLSWRFGHFPFTAHAMDDFFNLYRRESGGLDLRRWINQRYPAEYTASKEARSHSARQVAGSL